VGEGGGGEEPWSRQARAQSALNTKTQTSGVYGSPKGGSCGGCINPRGHLQTRSLKPARTTALVAGGTQTREQIASGLSPNYDLRGARNSP
jgi:hypothetical protein